MVSSIDPILGPLLVNSLFLCFAITYRQILNEFTDKIHNFIVWKKVDFSDNIIIGDINLQ